MQESLEGLRDNKRKRVNNREKSRAQELGDHWERRVPLIGFQIQPLQPYSARAGIYGLPTQISPPITFGGRNAEISGLQN
jgi:hypothetical protein